MLSWIFRAFLPKAIACLVALVVLVQLALGADWPELADGRHSFRTLGKKFSVEVPMKHVEGARLRLFSRKLAERLGLDLSGGPAGIEKRALSSFALFVDPTGKSPLHHIATRYQDSASKAAGEALGDGRAVWVGELAVKGADGRITYLDVTLKGIGQTPLAWLNHEKTSHKDGLQSMDEAIHSFIHSEANVDNGIQSTLDLAVIEIPGTKFHPDGRALRTAITVRVGKQTRLAHLRYFAGTPDFDKIFDYVVRRDLGLSPGTVITREHQRAYVREFTDHLAEDTARAFDLHAVHGSPTIGNKTTQGTTIDIGTFRYLDAHHPDYKYLYKQLQLGGEYGQVEQQRRYLEYLFGYLKESRHPLARERGLLHKMFDRFDTRMENRLTDIFLARIGLDEADRAALRPETRRRFYRAAKSLYEAASTKLVSNGSGDMIRTAAFDVRDIFPETIRAATQPASRLDAAWKSAFRNRRWWKSLKGQEMEPQLRKYRGAVESILKQLSPDRNTQREWIARSRAFHAHERVAPGESFYYGEEKYALQSEVTRAIEADAGFDEITARAEAVAKSLTDEGLAEATACERGAFTTLQQILSDD